jgi:hypothetical protein
MRKLGVKELDGSAVWLSKAFSQGLAVGPCHLEASSLSLHVPSKGRVEEVTKKCRQMPQAGGSITT